MTTERMALDRTSPFRRRRFIAPHRRKSSVFMLIRPFMTATLVVGIPVLAVYWLSVTPRFDLQRIDGLGTRLVPEEQLVSALEPLRGRHLLMLSLDDVETLVRQNRWVDGATIRKELPNMLIV
ncbi:MAG: FtsQ-type POTRA domain-containing protein [Acidobacteriota bacterium]